ncbi:MAG: hypothetical protein ACRYHA_24195 [Janthinobacterium lividum]
MTNRCMAILACACLAMSGGCAMLGMQGSHAGWREFTFIATPDANRNSPVAIDVALISNHDALEKVVALTAAQWFASRADLGATFPQGIRYRSWEIVPGQTLAVDKRAFAGSRVIAALVFANYGTPGAHRLRIDGFDGRVVVTMTATGFTLTSLK